MPPVSRPNVGLAEKLHVGNIDFGGTRLAIRAREDFDRPVANGVIGDLLQRIADIGKGIFAVDGRNAAGIADPGIGDRVAGAQPGVANIMSHHPVVVHIRGNGQQLPRLKRFAQQPSSAQTERITCRGTAFSRPQFIEKIDQPGNDRQRLPAVPRTRSNRIASPRALFFGWRRGTSRAETHDSPPWRFLAFHG